MTKAPLLKASTLLSRLQLFRNVDLDSISECIARCRFTQLDTGEMLLSPEVKNRSMYTVFTGRLEVYLEYPGGTAIAVVEPGELVGEMSIIEDKNPSAYVVASEPSQVMDIPQEVLWDMISASHQVTRNMLHILSLRVRFSNVVIAESLQHQQEYMRHATIDALTGLHNRRWLDSMFEQEMLHSRRENTPLTLLMIDVDNFKNYNDTHGHIAGDYALIAVADALRGAIRPNDMLARFGGEEFALLLTEANQDESLIIAERLRQTVAYSEVVNDKGENLPSVTVSIGLAALIEQETLAEFIADADTALYDAKRQGRNRVCG